MLLNASHAGFVGACWSFYVHGFLPFQWAVILVGSYRVITSPGIPDDGLPAGSCCLTPVSKVGKDSPLALPMTMHFLQLCPLLPWSHLLTTSERPVNKQGQKLELVEEVSLLNRKRYRWRTFAESVTKCLTGGANPSTPLHRWGQRQGPPCPLSTYKAVMWL